MSRIDHSRLAQDRFWHSKSSHSRKLSSGLAKERSPLPTPSANHPHQNGDDDDDGNDDGYDARTRHAPETTALRPTMKTATSTAKAALRRADEAARIIGGSGRRARSNTTTTSRGSRAACRAMKQWEVMQPELYAMLESGDLKSSPSDEVLDLVEDKKAVLVDVRLAPDYDEVHAINAVSVPLFRSIQTLSIENAIKSVFYTLNGVKGTEENPEFVDALKAVYSGLSEGQRLYFMCDGGGTCEAVPGFIYGKRSRSLQAIYKAVSDADLPQDRLGHVKGGLRGWASEGNLGLAGEDVESWKKKAGAVPF